VLLEAVAADPAALLCAMTAAAGTTHPNVAIFVGTTVLMGLITTLTEETTSPYGMWCSLGVLEDFLVGLEEFL